MMKKTILKVLAIVLVICCVLPLAAACTQAPPKETSTKKPTATKTEQQTEEDTDPEEETNNRTESSICFVGDDAAAAESVFFDSLDDAVAAYPEGAVIKLSFKGDLVIDKPFHFPETGNFVLDFNNCSISIDFDAGYVLECRTNGMKKMQYMYYNSLDALLEENSNRLRSVLEPEVDAQMDPYVPYLWVFEETDDMEIGRYAISNIHAGEEDVEPEFEYERVEDLSMWGVPYVAVCDNRYFYDLQEAIDASSSDAAWITVSVIGNCEAKNEDKKFIVPDNYLYRIPYSYSMVHGKFDIGVTFDDGAGGYCYYSTVEFLSSRPLTSNSVVWIWGNSEGYEPGKYLLTSKPENWSEEKDGAYRPDTLDWYIFSVGGYVYTRIEGEGTSEDDFFAAMEADYEAWKNLDQTGED